MISKRLLKHIVYGGAVSIFIAIFLSLERDKVVLISDILSMYVTYACVFIGALCFISIVFERILDSCILVDINAMRLMKISIIALIFIKLGLYVMIYFHSGLVSILEYLML